MSTIDLRGRPERRGITKGLPALRSVRTLPALGLVSALLLVACGGAALSARARHSAGAAGTAAARPAGTSVRRALVLGSGGPTGRAFQIGILKGLRDAGIDLTQADLVVGTSAGAVLGSQVRAGKSLDSLYDALFHAAKTSVPAPSDPDFDPTYYLQTIQMIDTATAVTPALRLEVGKRALAATKVLSEQTQLHYIDANMGGLIHEWPSGPLKLAAGDVADGTIRFFDSTQRVPIEEAIAASAAAPGRVAPTTIGDRRYMDGFVGGPCPRVCWANIDGASGYGVVVVVALGGSAALTQQVEEMRSRGSQVIVISPDAESAAARGQNPFDLSRLGPAAQVALRQAAAVAAEVRAVWGGS